MQSPTTRGPFRFHCGVLVDGITAQTNWLGQLLLHGQDIARAVKAPWELAERDMLLVLRGGMQIGPAFLRGGIPPETDVRVALQLAAARPYLIHIHDGTAEIRAHRPDDRADALLRVPAETLTLVFYHRIGPLTAVCRGLRIIGGRRPWVALKLQSYFEPA